jgi:hypothetical protein
MKNYEDWLTHPKGLLRLAQSNYEADITQVLSINFEGERIDLDPQDTTQIITLAILDGVTQANDALVNNTISNILAWNQDLEEEDFRTLLLMLVHGDIDAAANLLLDVGLDYCPCDGINVDCDLCRELDHLALEAEIEESTIDELRFSDGLQDLSDVRFNLN